MLGALDGRHLPAVGFKALGADSQKRLSHYRRAAASFAALWPHMPWTPPPGGVEEEQM